MDFFNRIVELYVSLAKVLPETQIELVIIFAYLHAGIIINFIILSSTKDGKNQSSKLFNKLYGNRLKYLTSIVIQRAFYFMLFLVFVILPFHWWWLATAIYVDEVIVILLLLKKRKIYYPDYGK